MSEIHLRPYQQDFIDAVRQEFIKQNKRVVGVAPCGAGKTIMTGWMIRESALKGKRSIFFVHRDELIAQTAQTFYELDIPFGVIASGQEMKLDQPVQIASVQTLAKRLDKIPTPDFLICDECHHILATTYRKILDAFPKAFLLGVTATPQRTGGITLCDVFQSMVESLSVNELIQLGNLTPFKYFAPEIGVDLSSVRQKFGEFVENDIAKIMTDKKIIGGIIENYCELAGGKQAICYCVNVEHSEFVADAFNRAGISAAHVDGNTPKNLRADLVDKFRRDEIQILCNCNLFSEGFDVPHCQAVILARPTMSLTLYIQQAMRPMRPDPADPNKVAIIIDHVQNYQRHGLPNAEHDWTLEPNEKNSAKRKCPECKKLVQPERTPEYRLLCPLCSDIIKKSAKPFSAEELREQTCPHCSKSVKPKRKTERNLTCPKCGYLFPKGEAVDHGEPDTSEYDGSLIEIDTNQQAFNTHSTPPPRIKHKPTTIEEFVEIGKKNNRHRAWAVHQALEYANSYKDCLHIAEVVGYKPGAAWHLWQERKAEISFNKELQNARCLC